MSASPHQLWPHEFGGAPAQLLGGRPLSKTMVEFGAALRDGEIETLATEAEQIDNVNAILDLGSNSWIEERHPGR